MSIVKIPVAAILALYDPFRSCPWDGNPMSVEMIREAVDRKNFLYTSYSDNPEQMGYWEYFDHVARVAYLVVNPKHDPISIDVGIPGIACFDPNQSHSLIDDGNHRFMAAVVRGDEFIYAEISGSVTYAEHLFGIKMAEFA